MDRVQMTVGGRWPLNTGQVIIKVNVRAHKKLFSTSQFTMDKNTWNHKTLTLASKGSWLAYRGDHLLRFNMQLYVTSCVCTFYSYLV